MIIIRIILTPFLLISLAPCMFFKWLYYGWLFILYGGEYITYGSEIRRKAIEDVYKIVAEEHERKMRDNNDRI